MKKQLIALTLFLLSNYLVAQDAHFTNYRNADYLFNPSNTGSFLGNQKIQSAYRSQYQNIYSQAIVSAEMNIVSPLNDAHWIGLGVNVGYDKMGTLDLIGTNLGARLAYHIGMDNKRSSVIRIGMGYDFFNISLDTDSYRSELTILGLNDPDLIVLSSFSPNFYSLHFGLGFSSKVSKKNTINFGVSIAHINQPRFNAISAADQPFFGRRINFNTSYIAHINKSFEVEPAIYMSFSENQSNINSQIMTAWAVKANHNWRMVTGITHRYAESVGLVIGYKDPRLYLTLCTDLLVSQSLDHFNNPGAVELGAFYIIQRDKIPKIKPVFLCPSL